MSDGDVVKPYEPLSGIRGVHNIDSYEIVSAGGSTVSLLPADPSRLYALIFFALSGATVSPFPNSIVYGIDSTLTTAGRSLLLHHASYPGLVQREWWIRWSAPGSAMVVDVSAKG